MTISDRVRIKNIHALSERHYRLNEVEFDYRRGDGEWQTQKREVFDRGHCRGAAAVQSGEPHHRADAAVPPAGLSCRP